MVLQHIYYSSQCCAGGAVTAPSNSETMAQIALLQHHPERTVTDTRHRGNVDEDDNNLNESNIVPTYSVLGPLIRSIKCKQDYYLTIEKNIHPPK